MTEFSHTAGSRAAAVLIGLGLTLGAAGCSSLDADGSYAGGDYGDEGATTGADAGETGGDTSDGSEETGGDEGTDTGDTGDDGNEGGGLPPDPMMSGEACDPDYGQVLDYDLAEAASELAPALVRELVQAEGKVPMIPLSPRPFLNHYDFDYAPAGEGSLELSGELWKPDMINNLEGPKRYRLQFALRAPALSPDQRPPVDLAVVVDLGPSMAGEPLVLAEEALAALEAALRPGDRITLIAAGESPTVINEGTLITDADMSPLTGLIDQEQAPAYADVSEAIELAYELTAEPWQGQGQQRVLLVSNGHFQAEPALVELVEGYAEGGHYLLTVGVGDPYAFVSTALHKLARHGRGASLYAATADELWLELHDRFADHSVAVATDIELGLELPPGLSLSTRDPGWGGAPIELELGTLGPNDALVFHHELDACADLDPEAVIRVTAEWTNPALAQAEIATWEWPLAELGEGSTTTRKGAATVAYAEALIAYRNNPDPVEGYGAVLDAIAMIADALEAQPEDEDLIEMSEILAKLEG